MFGYVQIFEVLRKLFLIYTWKTSEDPANLQAKCDFIFIFVVIIPEFFIFIYGNVILYKPMQE